jgi:hypothetical protein
LCGHLLRDLEGAAHVYPDAVWPIQIADALRGLIHQANLAREQGHDAIPDDVRDALLPQLTQLRDAMLVGLSATTSPGTRPGERKGRGQPSTEPVRAPSGLPPGCRVALLH